MCKNSLQSVLGSVVFPFMHQRCCMSALSECFTHVANMSETEVSRLPPAVVDDLLGCALLLPLSFTNVRAGISATISATDSSGAQGGSCVAEVPGKVAELLYRRSEFKGEAGRLDRSLLDHILPSEMRAPDKDLNELLGSLAWHSPVSYPHRGMHHINIQEVRAVYEAPSQDFDNSRARCQSNRGRRQSRCHWLPG